MLSQTLQILFQPIWHMRIIDTPGLFNVFVFIPMVFIAVKELLPVTLVLNNLISFKPVLVPVIILFTVAFPLVSCVNCHILYPFIICDLFPRAMSKVNMVDFVSVADFVLLFA